MHKRCGLPAVCAKRRTNGGEEENEFFTRTFDYTNKYHTILWPVAISYTGWSSLEVLGTWDLPAE